ncbi:hypothetical protein F5Y15DRAFT_408894 [Xylariaceae sp. FL0016]|nr:hypothetical protein F5Y15DRAFT_408894 [Xylariaceae sp. FL0016]
MPTANSAWECRDQTDQAELRYNQPIRLENRRLKDENRDLKRLLRENGIAWPTQLKSSPPQPVSLRITRSSKPQQSLPHLPVEIQLRILSYALTSPHPIVDPLSKVEADRLVVNEKARSPYIAINILGTCRAYHNEGTKLLWSNNSFLFTAPEALKNFGELEAKYRHRVKSVTYRVIAKFFDDETRTHRLPRNHHPDLRKQNLKLKVHQRPQENPLARRGFRAYAWYQLIDFLEAMLPPYIQGLPHSAPRPKLFPSLEKLRVDFVNFGEDLFQYPPAALHDLASHQLGCTLHEVILTGLPSDECGLRVSTEMSGLLKDEGLLIDHAPTLVALKNGLHRLSCGKNECEYSSKVVRAMRSVKHPHNNLHHEHHGHSSSNLATAPTDEGEPPPSIFHSCRTIWKRVPIQLNDTEERRWELFDRISGMPWEDIEEEACMFDFIDPDFPEGMVCENCGGIHPGAIPPDELMDLVDDL